MYCKPSISFGETGGRVSIMIGPKNCGDKVVEDVVVTIPMPSCVTTYNLEPSIGTTQYDDKTKVSFPFTHTWGKILILSVSYSNGTFPDCQRTRYQC